MKGCECGNRFFFYFRKISDKEASELKSKNAVKEFEGRGGDIWNIRVKDGVYNIDIASLMKEEPIIVAGDEGRYLLSLSSAFRDKKKETKLLKRIRK